MEYLHPKESNSFRCSLSYVDLDGEEVLEPFLKLAITSKEKELSIFFTKDTIPDLKEIYAGLLAWPTKEVPSSVCMVTTS